MKIEEIIQDVSRDKILEIEKKQQSLKPIKINSLNPFIFSLLANSNLANNYSSMLHLQVHSETKADYSTTRNVFRTPTRQHKEVFYRSMKNDSSEEGVIRAYHV